MSGPRPDLSVAFKLVGATVYHDQLFSFVNAVTGRSSSHPLQNQSLSLYCLSPYPHSWKYAEDLPISGYLSSTTLPSGELVVMGITGMVTKVFISHTDCKIIIIAI